MGYKQFVKRLFPYIKNHIWKLVFVSILMIFATVLETAIPEITGQIVDNLFSTERSSDSALFFSITLFIVIALSSLFALTSTSLSSWVTNKVIMDLRVKMFSRLLQLPKSYFDKNTTGGTLSKLTYDVEQISAAASVIWLELIKSSMTVLILIIYLFYKNYLLSLSLLILLPLIYLAVKFSTTRIRSGSKKVQDSMGEMTHLLDENISGSDLVKIYNAQSHEKSKFFQLVTMIRQQRFKVDVAGAVNTSVLNLRVITPIFKEKKSGESKIISFYAKKARGMMARFIIQNRVDSLEDLFKFNSAEYNYVPAESSSEEIVFMREHRV